MDLFLFCFKLLCDAGNIFLSFNFLDFIFQLFYGVSQIVYTRIKDILFNAIDKLKNALIIMYFFHFLNRYFGEELNDWIFLNLTHSLWCTLIVICFLVNRDYFFLNFKKENVISQDCLFVTSIQTLKPLNLLLIW